MRNFLLQMGAPRWPPSPPAARSAPGSPWRSSIYAGKFTLGAREDAAGALGAHAVVVDDEGAVDDHVGDAGRVAVRVGIGGLVLDGGGVEDREVGEVAGLHQAALAQADALGRHAGHLVHRGLEREDLALARVLAEHFGERAVRARVRLAGPIAVALVERDRV